jgi:hypothetical protein
MNFFNNFFSNLGIGTRLWLLVFFMALMILVGGGVGLVGITMANNALEKTY